MPGSPGRAGTTMDIADAVLSGQRVSVFLQPDQKGVMADSNRYPPYTETYPLPFMFVTDGIVWGATGYTHTYFQDGKAPEQVCCFYYCADASLYAITYYEALARAAAGQGLSTTIQSGRQYLDYRMRVRPAGTCVWKLGDATTEALCVSIHDGSPHYAVLEFQDGSAASLPLDLAYHFTDDGSFELRTQFVMLSSLVIQPNALLDQLRSGVENFDDAVKRPEFTASARIETHVPVYRIRSDGTAVEFRDIARDERKPLTGLRVFANP